jgi:hypothetical protein
MCCFVCSYFRVICYHGEVDVNSQLLKCKMEVDYVTGWTMIFFKTIMFKGFNGQHIYLDIVAQVSHFRVIHHEINS